MIRKIGKWTGSIKRYFSDIQKGVTDIEETIEEEISIKEKYSKKVPYYFVQVLHISTKTFHKNIDERYNSIKGGH